MSLGAGAIDPFNVSNLLLDIAARGESYLRGQDPPASPKRHTDRAARAQHLADNDVRLRTGLLMTG
jgi:hypothetical protein